MTRLLHHRTREACAVALAGLLVCLVPGCADSRTSAPERAARDFLAAVAAGKATDALTFLHQPPTDGQLLTDTVLGDAVARAPVTEIVATQRGGGDADDATVDVSYQVDGVLVTDTYRMVQVDGEWFLDETLPTIPAYTYRPRWADVTVDGVVVEASEAWRAGANPTSVLPGRYQFGLDHPMLEVGDADFTVRSLHAPATLTGRGPQTHLTADASQKVATAAADTLTACLKDTTSRTPCGISSDGAWVRDAGDYRKIDVPTGATVAWSLEPGGTDLATTRPDWGLCGRSTRRSVVAEGSICVDGIRVAARLVFRNSVGVEETATQARVGYVANLSDPDNIRITFLEP